MLKLSPTLYENRNVLDTKLCVEKNINIRVKFVCETHCLVEMI